MITRLTLGQIKQIATEIAKRWKFENGHIYYNCIDTKTGQRSIDGGDKNFASYYCDNAIEALFLKLTGNTHSFLDYSNCGVGVSNARKAYITKIKYKIVELLCGFKNEETYTNIELYIKNELEKN